MPLDEVSNDAIESSQYSLVKYDFPSDFNYEILMFPFCDLLYKLFFHNVATFFFSPTK